MPRPSESSTRIDRRDLAFFTAILLFFFISGAAGLLYQVVWTRRLVLLFGTTSFAVSTVLSIFFLGLGLGGLWGGRLADSTRRPLFVYGVFEIIIGVWALLFILLIGEGEAALVGALRSAGNTRALGVLMRALLSGAFLIVPVTLMGATLPLLAKFVLRKGPVRSFRIGALYSLNTFGAVAGCAVTGFYFLAELGYIRTTLLGAGLNISIGILSMRLSGIAFRDREEALEDAAPGTDLPPISLSVARLAVLAFAVSGFCALALEVLWTRLLVIVFTGTTYAFTTMLTTVLCGIALGSSVAALIVDRIRRPVLFFGLVQILTGVSCLLMLVVFPTLPGQFREGLVDVSYRWESEVFLRFLYSFLVLFVPTFFFGMSFPAVLKIVTSSRSTLGSDVGRMYSANTFGGVLGAIAGGFILIPVFGTQNGIVLLSFLICLMGAVLLFACPSSSRLLKTLLLPAGAVAAIGSFLASPSDVSRSMNDWYVPAGHEVLHFSEGVEGTVLVSGPRGARHESERVLWINAIQATASERKGLKMNRFQGVLPFLFDRDMNHALFMCFGSGVTAGTLGIIDFERIDAVEISSDVLEAAELFRVDNLDVRNNDRVNFIVDDGRNFLLTTENKYDLITFEPMPLAITGVSTFYTKEYYELCRDHLTPRGLISQWVPLHNLREDLIRSLINTFLSVFPESCAWFINADLFIVGSNEPLRLDYNAVEALWSGNDRLRHALEEANLRDVPEIMASFIMDKENLHRYAQGSEVMTDDRPWAEFIAAKIKYEPNIDEALKTLRPLMEPPTTLMDPSEYENWDEIKATLERRHRAHIEDTRGLEVYYRDGPDFAQPEVHFEKALDIDPKDYNAQYYLIEINLGRARSALSYDRPDEAIAYLKKVREFAGNDLEVVLTLADAYHSAGQTQDAARSYRAYLDLGGQAHRATERSAGVALESSQ